MPASNEDKASRYHRLKRRAELLRAVTTAAFLLVLLVGGWSLQLREAGAVLGMIIGRGFEESGTVIGYATALAVLLSIVELPFAAYQGYLLEHRYGLSNQDAAHWTLDQVKAALVGSVLTAGAASIVYWTLREMPRWWWIASAALLGVVMIGLAQLAPVLLLPLFYRFRPLDRPALADRLLALAARARTPVIGVYEWVLSAHTKKANAALAGIGRTRRILLSDTLLADYSDDEIEVVLAHELAHQVHHDLWRVMAIQSATLVAALFAAHLALMSLADVLALRGADDPAGLPLLMLAGGACSWLAAPIANSVSRAHERRADSYALDMTGQPEAFVSAMKRLSQQNLAEDDPSRLVRWLFYSHPPIRERIETARAWKRDAFAESPPGVPQRPARA
jgi:STE24 endopeptidase